MSSPAGSLPPRRSVQEAPRFVDDPADCEIVALQFVPPVQVRIEFSRQIAREVALSKLVVKPSSRRMVTLHHDPEGYHIWIVSPTRTDNGSYPFEVVVQILTPEVADLLRDFDVHRQAVLSREQWLAKRHREHRLAESERERWEATQHPCGLTFGQIMDFEPGWYEANGWFLWRGTSRYGDRADGFQDLQFAEHEAYNNDIRFFLREGHDLVQAVRIQDEMWMENFWTMIAALANFYASTPGPGAKPALPSRRVPARTSSARPATPPGGGPGSLDRALQAVERTLDLAAQGREAYQEIAAAWEHASEQMAAADLAAQVNEDVDALLGFVSSLAAEADDSPPGGAPR